MIFWLMIPCSLVGFYQHLEATYDPHPQCSSCSRKIGELLISQTTIYFNQQCNFHKIILRFFNPGTNFIARLKSFGLTEHLICTKTQQKHLITLKFKTHVSIQPTSLTNIHKKATSMLFLRRKCGLGGASFQLN